MDIKNVVILDLNTYNSIMEEQHRLKERVQEVEQAVGVRIDHWDEATITFDTSLIKEQIDNLIKSNPLTQRCRISKWFDEHPIIDIVTLIKEEEIDEMEDEPEDTDD